MTVLQSFGFRLGRGPDLDDDLSGLPQGGGGLYDLNTGLLVSRVRETGQLPGPTLDDAGMPKLLQLQRRSGRHRNPGFALKNLFRCTNLHGQFPLASHPFRMHYSAQDNFTRQAWGGSCM